MKYLLFALGLILISACKKTEMLVEIDAGQKTPSDQISYTSFEKKVEHPYGSLIFLDIDKDGVTDITFSSFSQTDSDGFTAGGFMIKDNNPEVSFLTQDSKNVSVLNSNDLVDNRSINWRNTGSFMVSTYAYHFYRGQPSVATSNKDNLDHYIGFRMKHGNFSALGWIRINTTDFISPTVHDFAYIRI